MREWRGRTHTVVVTEDGFEHARKTYSSLSKIAQAITGAHWSGPRFFGLKPMEPTGSHTDPPMGRLTLNILLSFAQFEREVTGERIRDKIAASKKKGMWMGGLPSLGYDVKDRRLVEVTGFAKSPEEAEEFLRQLREKWQ